MSNAANIRAFRRDLTEVARELRIDVATVAVKIALDLHAKISARTPVDTGRARASWDIKEGGPSDFKPPEGSYSGPNPVDSASLKGTDVIFVTSAVEYMEFLEAGSSKQAPAGMVDVAIAEVSVEIDSTIARIRSRRS